MKAEYAVANAAMIACKPVRLSYIEAASVPVVASTAWQMVFDHGQVDNTKLVLVHGAAGNVGAYAVRLARGVLVSSVAMPDQDKAARYGVRGVFFLVTITSEGLTKIADLLDSGQLKTSVGEVLPLAEARLAHEILAGKPHKRGKIVLVVDI